MMDHGQVWYPSTKEGWDIGAVVAEDDAKVTVKTTDGSVRLYGLLACAHRR